MSLAAPDKLKSCMFVFFKVSSCTIAWLCRKMLLRFCRFTPNIFIQRLRLNTRCRQQKNSPNAVDYHGKIWCFRQGVAQTVWVGSHNFSDEGLKKRLEAGTRITDQQDLAKIESFIDSLCGINCAVTIDKLAPAAADVQSYKGLPKYTSLPAVKATSMEIKLRPSEQPQSSLNLCFGAGRKNQQGIYTPRPWYEIELSVPKSAQTNDVYPRPLPSEIPPGKKSLRMEFTAYLTHDGVTYRKASLSTYSDGNKAMGSKPRTIFGEFIKGGLESAGVLRRGEPITDEVLEAYGRDSVTLTKLTNGEYVVTF